MSLKGELVLEVTWITAWYNPSDCPFFPLFVFIPDGPGAGQSRRDIYCTYR